MSKTVAVLYFSPSNHGEGANKCLKSGCYEDKHTRPMTEAAKKYLEPNGFEVHIAAKGLSVKERCAEADRLGADWYFPTHTNAFEDEDARYLLFMCLKTDGEYRKMFDAVSPYVEAIYPEKKEAVFKVEDGLLEINLPKAKTFYCEWGFHTNKTDVEKFIHNPDAIGKALAKGICKYYGVTFKEPAEKEETKKETKKTTTTKTETKKETKKVVIPKKVKSKVVTASIKAKGKNYKVADHFTLGEFQCNNGADTVKYDKQIVTALEAARLFFNVPITITSAYRPPDYNRKIGGATGSYHTKGRAVDHYCKLSYTLLAKFYQAYGLKGIGCYYDDHFVHIDSRATKFYWKNQSSTKVSTHLVTVRSGDDNQHVVDLQWLLKNKHKFNIKVDGGFGAKTQAAVKEFQKKRGLSADGVVGSKTWKQLLKI